MVRQSAAVLTFKSSFSPWEQAPAHYIFCTRDVSIPLKLQKAVASQPGKWSTSSLDTGHSPQLVCPGDIARLVDAFVQDLSSEGAM
jgi:pimeloyl-ACP methyl ester carboxylesterase